MGSRFISATFSFGGNQEVLDHHLEVFGVRSHGVGIDDKNEYARVCDREILNRGKSSLHTVTVADRR